MKTKLLILIVALAFGAGIITAAPMGTAFTYQGRLKSGGQPANGLYDLQFTLYDAATNGVVVAGPLTNAPAAVSNGNFAVILDFGGNGFLGDARWLEIAVRTNGSGGPYGVPKARQALTPTPYALFAASANYAEEADTANSANYASAVSAGAVSGAGLQANAVTTDKVADGTLLPTDLNGSAFNTTFWKATGNAGTTLGTHFLGTTDSQPLEFKVNNQRALRLEPTPGGSLNVIGGAPGNWVANGVRGATLAGGGASGSTNSVSANYATVGGGQHNAAASQGATVAGGEGNTAGGSDATVGGGANNTASGGGAAIGGGSGNTAAGFLSVIGGGGQNQAKQGWATIAGGDANRIETDADHATIGGGGLNTIQTNSQYATIGGGYNNTIQTNAAYAVIAGGYGNEAWGRNSFAGGQKAKAGHPGAFVWADETSPFTTFASTTSNQFLIRATGGVGIGKNNPSTALDVNGTVTASAFVGNGSGLGALSAASISSGTLPEARVDSGITRDTEVFSLVLNSDGLGSMLDADLLDGQHANAFANAAHNHDATNINSGTLADARLSSNVAKLNANQMFTSSNTFSGVVTATNLANTLVGTFTGTGVGLNNLNASQLASGSVPDARLAGTYSGALTFNNVANQFSGNGANLAGLNAGNLGSGTVPDARLSANVAVLTGSPAFAGSVTAGSDLAAARLRIGDNHQLAGTYAGIAGGQNNTNQADRAGIMGGQANAIQVGSQLSCIGGGEQNVIQPYAGRSVIAGGSGNTIGSYSGISVIGGGGANTILDFSGFATIAGGSGNLIRSNANDATIGGGSGNSVTGDHATIPGGWGNTATNLGFAAGRRAKANHTGAFVWADSTEADFASSEPNQFLIRASGGVGIGKDNPATALDVQGTVTATSFSGSGAILANLNASQLASGAVPDGRLAGTYTFPISFNNYGNSFAGSGALLHDLNASQFTSGTVPDARLADSVARTNQVWLLGGNTATTPGTQFLGTKDNQPLEIKVNNQRALRLEPSGATVNVIAGNAGNWVASGVYGATIAGGGGSAQPSGVAARYATVGGGLLNTIQTNSADSTISGGAFNTIQTDAHDSSIGGGYNNIIAVNTPYATIAGGAANDIGTNSASSTISGGYDNNVSVNSASATIAGGYFNNIGLNSDYSAIGGGQNNNIAADSMHAAIAGGYRNAIGTNSDLSAIGGGEANNIAADSGYATIAGGVYNNIGTNSDYSAVNGGYNNKVAANSGSATIAGGNFNDIGASSTYSAIGGGYDNNVAVDSYNATIAGGLQNDIGTNSDYSAIGGGQNNNIAADSYSGTIAGGYYNDIGGNSDYGAIGGGWDNNIAANAPYATIPGGRANEVASYAFAAGYNAKATNLGAFVWSDSTGAITGSTNNYSVTFRASGGYRFFTGTGSSGAQLLANATAWSVLSDRNLKKDLRPVNGQLILDKLSRVPVSQWHYEWERESDPLNLGPMAQDFKAAFFPGRDDTSISTLEFDGVALAAIQGLNKRVESGKQEAESRMERLEAENAELKARLEKLEQLVNAKNGGGQ